MTETDEPKAKKKRSPSSYLLLKLKEPRIFESLGRFTSMDQARQGRQEAAKKHGGGNYTIACVREEKAATLSTEYKWK
jgi:hypothetical protein